jgi:hypothetical protein
MSGRLACTALSSNLKAYGNADCRWGFNPRDAQPPFANFKPPAAEEEIPAFAFQFVR